MLFGSIFVVYLDPGELVVGEGEQETRGECQNQEQERKLCISSRNKILEFKSINSRRQDK
jgi:hypothetical protein